jgi:SOS-response transcriptional repressor LexA
MAGVSPAPRRRDEALAFIIDRLVRTGMAPSTDEIGRALDVCSTRAKQLVNQLIADGVVERTPGAKRGLVVRDVTLCRSIVDQALRRMGWAVSEPMGEQQQAFPKRQLPRLPAFEHLPED